MKDIDSKTAGIVIGIVVLLVLAFGVYKWRQPAGGSGPSTDANTANQEIEAQYKQAGGPAPSSAGDSTQSDLDAQYGAAGKR
jgi:hypothetical protein